MWRLPLILFTLFTGITVSLVYMNREYKKSLEDFQNHYVLGLQNKACVTRYQVPFSQIMGQEVPECPQGDGFTLLSRMYPPGHVFVGYSGYDNQVAFIKTMIGVLKDQKPRPRISILVPRLENEDAYERLRDYLEDDYREFVSFLPMPSDETLWTQDYFEPLYHLQTERVGLLDLPYKDREGEMVPSALALSCQVSLIAQPSYVKEEPSNGDYGGNIEAMPGGVIAIGDSMTHPLRGLLKSLWEDRLIELRVRWLETGHVDELFSILPVSRKSADGSCGFTLLHASPQLALNLIEQAPSKGTNGKWSPDAPPEVALDHRSGLPPYDRCLKEMESNKESLSPLCRQLVAANQSYEETIQKEKKRLQAFIEHKAQCKLETMAFPQMFGPSSAAKKYSTDDDFAFAINPNSINNISLGKTLVVAQQEYQPFQDFIEKELETLPLKPVWINAALVHYLNGGIHCASNMVRVCRNPQAKTSRLSSDDK